MIDLSFVFNGLVSLATLTFLEIILGIDNLVFISILSARLQPEQRSATRRLGLLFALVTRLLFLASVLWLAGLVKPLIDLFGHTFSARDILLLGGGLFLLIKSTQEIHNEFVETKTHQSSIRQFSRPIYAIMQIMLLDIVFSLDSIFTAVGLTQDFYIMATAICIAMFSMIYLSDYLSKLIHKYSSVKMLALSFLILIGTVLIADGLGFTIPRAYVYVSIAFSLFVETLNNLKRSRTHN